MSLIPCPSCQCGKEKEDPKRNNFTGKPCSVCAGKGEIQSPFERVQKAMISFKLTRMFLAQIHQLYGLRFSRDKNLIQVVTEQDQPLLKMGIGIFESLGDDLEDCSKMLKGTDNPIEGLETMAKVISISAGWLSNMAQSTVARLNLEPYIKKIDESLEKVQTELQRSDYTAIADCLEFEFGEVIGELLGVLKKGQSDA